jgi:hypothetical protein
MMNYMGMPSDKRGDAPSKRWQGAALKNKEIVGDKLKESMVAKQKNQKALRDFYDKGRTRFKMSDIVPMISEVADREISALDGGIDADSVPSIIAGIVTQRVNREEGDPYVIIKDEIDKLKKKSSWF